MNQIKRKNKQIYHRLIVGLFIGLVLFMIPFAFDAYTSYRENRKSRSTPLPQKSRLQNLVLP